MSVLVTQPYPRAHYAIDRRRPHILWIGKSPTNGGTSGEEVFDARAIAALRTMDCYLDVFHPQPVSRAWEAALLSVGALPYPRTRYSTRKTTQLIRAMSCDYDVIICSWEPFDALVRHLPRPTILIVHNVYSQGLPAIYPGSLLARLGAARAATWERRWYRASRFAAIAALSRADLAYLGNIPDAPTLLWTPPGMPPCIELDPQAELIEEIVLSGTYGWPPKQRDADLFVRDYAALDARLPVRADMSGAARDGWETIRQLDPLPLPTAAENRQGVRIGLITDRFQSGHKLKTLAYLASNQIVLSFANIGFDFRHIPDHELFVRRIGRVSEINSHVRALSAIPDLGDRFGRFKTACARQFTWDGLARSLLAAIPVPHQDPRGCGQ
jgi:hypothetical protein